MHADMCMPLYIVQCILGSLPYIAELIGFWDVASKLRLSCYYKW